MYIESIPNTVECVCVMKKFSNINYNFKKYILDDLRLMISYVDFKDIYGMSI